MTFKTLFWFALIIAIGWIVLLSFVGFIKRLDLFFEDLEIELNMYPAKPFLLLSDLKEVFSAG